MAIATAQFDPLRKSGEAFNDRLQQLRGGDVSFRRFAGIHQLKDIPTAEGREMKRFIEKWIKDNITWELVAATKARVEMDTDVRGLDDTQVSRVRPSPLSPYSSSASRDKQIAADCKAFTPNNLPHNRLEAWLSGIGGYFTSLFRTGNGTL